MFGGVIFWEESLGLNKKQLEVSCIFRVTSTRTVATIVLSMIIDQE